LSIGGVVIFERVRSNLWITCWLNNDPHDGNDSVSAVTWRARSASSFGCPVGLPTLLAPRVPEVSARGAPPWRLLINRSVRAGSALS